MARCHRNQTYFTLFFAAIMLMSVLATETFPLGHHSNRWNGSLVIVAVVVVVVVGGSWEDKLFWYTGTGWASSWWRLGCFCVFGTWFRDGSFKIPFVGIQLKFAIRYDHARSSELEFVFDSEFVVHFF